MSAENWLTGATKTKLLVQYPFNYEKVTRNYQGMYTISQEQEEMFADAIRVKTR